MEQPVQPGDLLADKYRVERVLGQGGMGVVVAATHEQLGQKVALKFLLPEAASGGEAVARFLREAKATVRLKSEHVARVLDVGTLPTGSPYIVMEYLDGRDLHAVIKEMGQLPLDLTIEYLMQTCEALAEAHLHGIVHRDLKPANLFLTTLPDGGPCIKVLDFGISKITADADAPAMTRTSAVLGTPYYMSPEQLRSSRAVDARADLWSLGVILYELLTGQPAFPGETLPELCAAILTDPVRPLSELRPDLPAALDAVAARCLEKDPNARYQDIAQLAGALAPFHPGGAALASRIARISQRESRSNPAMSIRLSDPAAATMAAEAPRTTGPLALSAALAARPSAEPSATPASPAASRGSRAPLLVALAAVVLAGVSALAISLRSPATSAIEGGPALASGAASAVSVASATSEQPAASAAPAASTGSPSTAMASASAAPATPPATTPASGARTAPTGRPKPRPVGGGGVDFGSRK
jgi:serine/threonine-protein kinase